MSAHSEIAKMDVSREQVAVLMLFLDSLIRETMNPDVLHLSAIDAARRAEKIGIDAGTYEECLGRVLVFAHGARRGNPLHAMF